jgi:hypothetical protein
MEHSIAAKYAARPAARFVRPSARTRERRLGLRVTGTFRATAGRATVLRRADLGPLARMRASWRAIRPAVPQRPVSGRPRPQVTMTWPRTGLRRGSSDRSSAASAPWHA